MAFGSVTTSAQLTCDANYEFFTDGTDAIVVTANPRELVNFIVTLDAPGETDDLEVLVLGMQQHSTGNGLDGATAANDIELDTAADGQGDDYYIGYYIIMTSGDEQGEGRLITDFVGADDGAVLSHSLSGTPSAGETYDLYRAVKVSEFQITAETSPTNDLPQHGGISVTGHQYYAVLARSTGSTDAHVALMSYQSDGVSA